MSTKPAKSTHSSLIFQIRGHNVMLDSDLAKLYDTETKKLKQQVRRNIDRFPEDFMFELSESEKKQLLEQESRLLNLKFSYAPIMVFSEQGVAMLSSVIHTKRAIYANIEIMRAFVSYRAMMIENKELRNEIIRLDKKINNSFKYLLRKIDALTPVLPQGSRKTVGFKRKDQS
jgi:hypothetical protein